MQVQVDRILLQGSNIRTFSVGLYLHGFFCFIMENWKDIDGYNGIYQISDKGRVRSNRTLKPTMNKRGYLLIGLHSDSVQKTHYIHRLVALAFIPNPKGKRTINHKDGNKQNNNVENLEWATDSENVSHAFANGLKQPVNGGSHGRAILTKEVVIEIKSLLSKKVKQRQIAEMFGVSIGAISRIKTGKNWKHLR